MIPSPTSESAESPPTHVVVYPSAVDWWLACLLILPIVAATAIGVLLFAQGRPSDSSTMFLSAAGITVVTGLLTLPCRYTLIKDALSVRCGLIVYQIPYNAIRSLSRSSTLKSGPALSICRVVVETDKRDYVLSPTNREQFMIDVRQRMNPETSQRESSPRPQAETR